MEDPITNPPPKDWLQVMADEHQINERRYSALERRIKTLEGRGRMLPKIDDENMVLYLMGAALFFEFVLPAVIRILRGDPAPAQNGGA
jgi:hypothetical protein